MSANGGNIAASGAWSDVFLDAGDAGSALAVALSEDPRSSLVWECRVHAQTEYGRFYCGSFRTRPPTRGELPTRLVATAFFPGATGWSTSWRVASGVVPADNGQPTRVTLASSPAGVGLAAGVIPVASRAGPMSNRNFSAVPAIGGIPVALLPAAALLFSIVGNLNDPAGPPAFVQLFDQVAAPVLGAVPFWSHSLGLALPVDTSDFAYPVAALAEGRPVDFTLWAALSSTSPLFTPIVGQTANATIEAALP